MNNSHTVEAHIKAFAKRENCIIGICDTAPLTLDTTRFTPFVSSNLAKRTDPAASLPGVKSIIVVGVESKIEAFPPMPEGAGILSVLGVAEDYHVVVKSLLKKLVDELRAQVNFMYKILVDSPTLDERALAVRAGLGFIGRNGLVISPEYGSRFNIGVLLTDIAIASEAKQSTILGLLPPRYARGRLCNAPCNDGGGGCSANQRSQAVTCPPNCRNCITACPTGALTRSNGLDAARCISYLTQKDNLTKEEAVLVGCHLYGCDICQNVCPLNRPAPTAWASPYDWLSMSDEDFAKVYGHTAMLWRGPVLLRRNAANLINNPYTL